MRWLWLVALGWAWTAAHAQDATTFTVAPHDTVLVPVDPHDGLVVLDPDRVRVTEVTDALLSVTALGPKGAAVVHLYREGRWTTLSFLVQGDRPAAPGAAPPKAGAPPVTEVRSEARGAVVVTEDRAAWTGLERATVHARVGEADVDALVAVVGRSGGPSGPSDVRLALRGPRGLIVVGDDGVVLGTGVLGASTRGARAGVFTDALGSGFDVVAGQLRATPCCDLVDPDAPRIVLGTATWVPWATDRLEAAAGVIDGPERGAVPAWRARVAHATDAVWLATEAFGVGPGAAWTTDGRVSTGRLLVNGRAWVLSSGLYEPIRGPRDADQLLASVDPEVVIVDGVTALGTAAVEHLRGSAATTVAVTGGLGVRVAPSPFAGLAARWQVAATDRTTADARTRDVRHRVELDTRVGRPRRTLATNAGVTLGDGVEAASALARLAIRPLTAWTGDGLVTASWTPGSARLTAGGGVELDRPVVGVRARALLTAWQRDKALVLGPEVSARLRVTPLPGQTFEVEGAFGTGAGRPTTTAAVAWIAELGLDRGSHALAAGARVAGVVFDDADADGVRDPGEAGVPDAVVQLEDGRRTTTDARGAYTLGAVVPGDHLVSVSAPGWRPTTPDARRVRVSARDRVTREFGLVRGARVIVRVVADRDGDGLADASEPTVPAEVTLDGADGARRPTSTDGWSVFDGVPPGAWTASLDPFGLPVGYVADTPEVALTVDGPTVVRATLLLREVRSVGGRVIADTSGDGRHDPTDGPGPGITVTLRRDGVALRDVTTDDAGRFLFRAVPAAAVTVDVPGAAPIALDFTGGPREVLDLVVFTPRDPRATPVDVTRPPPIEAGPVLARLRPLPGSVLLAPGERAPLEVHGVWSDGDARRLDAAWTSSAPDVARVDGGTVLGVRPGSATLTAAARGLVTPPVPVEVTEALVVGLTLAPAAVTLTPGETATLTARAVYVDGRVGPVQDVATWTAADATVATVDGGRVEAVAPGTTTVSATLAGVTAYPVTVTVTAAPVAALTLVAPARVVVGDPVGLAVTAVTVDGDTLDVTARAALTASDDLVIRLVGASAVARGPGRAVLVARWQGATATAEVEVRRPPPLGLLVDPAPGRVLAGATVPLRAVGVYADGTSAAVPDATWTTDDPTVARVDGGALIAGVAGRATLQAAVGDVRTSPIVVEVRDGRPVAVHVAAAALSVRPGDAAPLTAEVVLADGASVRAPVAWTSSLPAVARVTADGVVHGVALGSARVWATYGGLRSAPVDVEVSLPAPALLGVQPLIGRMLRGTRIAADATAVYGDGTVAAVGGLVTWDESDRRVLAVDPDGTVRAVGAGRADVVARWQGVEARQTVEVVDGVVVGAVAAPSEVAASVDQRVPVRILGVLADGSTVPLGTLATWRSGDPAVVEVSATGVLRARAPGDAAVTGTWIGPDGATHDATVTVTVR